MQRAKHTFNMEWCNKDKYPRFASWIAPDQNDVSKAKCTLCKRKISLSTMGKATLTRHRKLNMHKRMVKMTKKREFNMKWCDENRFPHYALWISPSRDKSCAYCKLCQSQLKIGRTGTTALFSHRHGIKHRALEQAEKRSRKNTQRTIRLFPLRAVGEDASKFEVSIEQA
jgi:hypothetical protein